MIEKNWLQQDYILIGFTRGAFILLILAILLYTLLWYKLGEWKAYRRIEKVLVAVVLVGGIRKR